MSQNDSKLTKFKSYFILKVKHAKLLDVLDVLIQERQRQREEEDDDNDTAFPLGGYDYVSMATILLLTFTSKTRLFIPHKI